MSAQSAMGGSLRRRLAVSLCAVMAAGWAATAWFSYRDTRQLIDDAVDSHLVQSADMLLVLLDRLPASAGQTPDAMIVATDPVQEFSFRIWTSPGFTAPAGGFADVGSGRTARRLYAAADQDGHRVEVAVSQQVRQAFAARVAEHILHPLWIALPLLGLLIWTAVRWGLRPLDHLAASVARRSAAQLEPLKLEAAPAEVMPLVSALNELFSRIARSHERDRRFAADAAHELRTPLAAIKTHAQVALRAARPEDRQQALDGVIAGVERGTRIVEQLLALARIDDGALAFATVDLMAAARQAVIDLAGKAAVRNIDISVSGPEDASSKVEGNGELLAVMIRNLVDNAILYSPKGGLVSIAVARGEGGVVTLRIEDRGPGLPPELRTRVLDRFYRVSSTGVQGSGLGLSIAVAIADLHGASLALEDRGAEPGLCAKVSFAGGI